MPSLSAVWITFQVMSHSLVPHASESLVGIESGSNGYLERPLSRGAYMRFRSRGLPRNRDLAGKSRWIRRGKTEEEHTRFEYGLPLQVIPGRLIDAMRVTPRGSVGWR